MTTPSTKATISPSHTQDSCSDDTALFGDLANQRQRASDELNTLAENYHGIEME